MKHQAILSKLVNKTSTDDPNNAGGYIDHFPLPTALVQKTKSNTHRGGLADSLPYDGIKKSTSIIPNGSF
jgi:hypothetical protein